MKVLLITGMLLAVVTGFSSRATLDETAAPAEALTDKVRDFLKKEMRLLAEGGRAIESALASGDDKTVATEAQKMHETFVHKDEVTTFDLRILQAELGEEFVTQDKAFHTLARELEKHARNNDLPEQRRVFDAMLRQCVACHKTYAPEAPVLE